VKILIRREVLISIGIVLLVVTSLSSIVHAQSNSGAITSAKGITLTIDFGNGTIRNYQNLNGSTVLDVTSSVLNVEVNWYGPLAYIRGIEGLVGEGAEGWEYWVNGEFASIAVNLYTLQDNDVLLWKYTRPELKSEYDPTFIPGVVFVLISGIGFIVIVYIQTSRRIL